MNERGPKPPTGIRANHRARRRRHLQRRGEAKLLAHRALTAGDQRVDAGCRVVRADRAARLHLAIDEPAVMKLAAHDMIRFGDDRARGVTIADLGLKAQVARRAIQSCGAPSCIASLPLITASSTS